MKTLLSLAFVLMLGATAGSAQWNGSIGIIADTGSWSPCLSANPGQLYVYFFHFNAIGATASQWAAPPPACFTGVHLSDAPVFAVNLGNTETGITIGYMTCKTGSFHVMTAVYQLTSVGTCCHWSVVADPNLPSGKIEIPDCDFNLTYGTAGQGIFGTNPTCCWDPVEDTTWGGVKALYVE